MTDAARSRKRQRLNELARRRSKREAISFKAATYRVRQSAVLIWLQRNPGRPIQYIEIARSTAVPVSAVRTICKRLAKAGHELMGGRHG